jgi:hypothetical protein
VFVARWHWACSLCRRRARIASEIGKWRNLVKVAGIYVEP